MKADGFAEGFLVLAMRHRSAWRFNAQGKTREANLPHKWRAPLAQNFHPTFRANATRKLRRSAKFGDSN